MNSAESSDFMAMNGKGFSGLWPLLEQPRQSYAGEFHLPFENMEQLESFIEIDVSRGHTLIPTYEPADVGGLILIQLVHPLTEELFPISGQVIEIREWDQELLGMLTRFVGLTDKHRDGLKKFISYGFNVL